MTMPTAKEASPDDQAITRTTSPGGGCMTRFMTSPFRALRRIRDMYVSSLGNCTRSGAASSSGGNNKISATAGMVAIMPRARSRTAFGHNYRSGPDGDDDFRELVRVNSKQVDAAAAAMLSTARPPAVTVVPRSQSVAASIGRIDEERPCEFCWKRYNRHNTSNGANNFSIISTRGYKENTKHDPQITTQHKHTLPKVGITNFTTNHITRAASLEQSASESNSPLLCMQ